MVGAEGRVGNMKDTRERETKFDLLVILCLRITVK